MADNDRKTLDQTMDDFGHQQLVCDIHCANSVLRKPQRNMSGAPKVSKQYADPQYLPSDFAAFFVLSLGLPRTSYPRPIIVRCSFGNLAAQLQAFHFLRP
jgi:hypothetical protein